MENFNKLASLNNLTGDQEVRFSYGAISFKC